MDFVSLACCILPPCKLGSSHVKVQAALWRRGTGGSVQSYPTWPNLASMMFALARGWPDKPMLRVWRGGVWQSITWGAFGRMAASAARNLRSAGVSAGDRVLLCMEN